MDYSTLLTVAVVSLLCSALQSLVGFGFALFATPPLILLGLPLPAVVAITLVGTLAQGVVATAQMRAHIQWRAISPVLLVRFASIPLGLLIMGLLVHWGPERVKQAVGLALLLILLLWSLTRVQPRERVGLGWGVAAGLGSGLLGGSLGMGGPPCVLWVLGHRWTSEQIRVSLITIFIATVPFQLALLWWQFGPEARHGILLGLLATPLLAAGSALGLRLSTRLPIVYLRRIMLVLLAGMALYAVATPIVQEMTRNTQ